mgnify:CR=1 FL=1
MNSVKHYLKIFMNLVIAALAIVLVVVFLPRLIVFFMPFVVGWIISLLANPLVQLLEKHLKIKRKAGSVFIIVVVIGAVAFLLYLAADFLTQQVLGFIENLPSMWEAIEQDLTHVGGRFQIFYQRMPVDSRQQIDGVIESVKSYMGNLLGNLSSPTVKVVSRFAMNVPSILMSILMGLLSAYFFVAEKFQINAFLQKWVPEPVKKRWRIVKETMTKAFGGYFLAQFKIELWMYLLLVIGLTIAGTKYAVLVALGIAILDFLPVFGTGTVLVPWAIIKILNGSYTTAIILLVLWGGGQLLRQLIQPRIVGDSLGLPALPTLILLFMGWRISGVGGMILAVPVGLVLYNLYRSGIFDTTIDSFKILANDLSAFCKYNAQDYVHYKKYEGEAEEKSAEKKDAADKTDSE